MEIVNERFGSCPYPELGMHADDTSYSRASCVRLKINGRLPWLRKADTGIWTAEPGQSEKCRKMTFDSIPSVAVDVAKSMAYNWKEQRIWWSCLSPKTGLYSFQAKVTGWEQTRLKNSMKIEDADSVDELRYWQDGWGRYWYCKLETHKEDIGWWSGQSVGFSPWA